MDNPKDIDSIAAYLRAWAPELGERIVQFYPPLHGFDDVASPLTGQLLRKPFPAQTLAMMGVVNRWNEARGAAVIAECGTGKTLISLGAVHVHSDRKPFTALAMVPPQLVEKWAREAFLTLPRVRVFFIDGLRTPTSSVGNVGVNEVRLRHGRIIREGLRTTLTELRQRRTARTARERWDSMCGFPALFIVGRDRGKLSYFWRHSYTLASCGRYQGSVVNADTGCPIYLGEDGQRLLAIDFKKAKLSEILGGQNGGESRKSRRALYSALWQADGKKIRRFAPVDFIGRYMRDFFDYAIADEVHELKGDTAQGNALGTLAGCAQRTVVLTGTLLGGYADEVFNILFRMHPARMVQEGFEYGESGVRAFTEAYGLLEKITVIEPEDNSCSEGRVTKRVRRRPGASPLLFGRFLMSLGAFISLEDISEALPPYREEVVSVEMDPPLKEAYKKLEEDVKNALKEHRGNQSVMSVALNALLLYPDRPFRLGNLYGWEFDPETQRREKFLIAQTRDLNEDQVFGKERCLVEEVKAELAHGRRCQIYAVYTQKRDVTRRLEQILLNEGIRVAVLTTDVPPESREGWYERQLRGGVQAVICHPKLVQTGLDLIDFPTILFYETGYSIYVLRQASRRSWRIGQRLPVKVKYLHYAETMQESCLRLMGKKLLVSLAMEGKFSSEGLQALNEEDDILMAMARELVTEKGIGERADAVWATLQKQQEDILRTPAMERAEALSDQSVVAIPLIEPGSTRVDQWSDLKSPLEAAGRKDSTALNAAIPGEQLTLF
jgi:hypothetical protein